MNYSLKKPLFFLLIFCFVMQSDLFAQNFENAGEYLSYINSVQSPIQQDYMSYASTVARGKSARKVESRRKEIIQSVSDAQNKVKAVGPYKGDKSYRDSTLKYLNMAYKVLNEDYSKIVNMEEVAEQSYDAMEAYYLAQDIAADKLGKAWTMVDTTFYLFAKKYNVTIQEGETTQLSRNVQKAADAMAYQRMLYLIFFKPFKQEVYMLDAINKKNLSGIEQNKNSLISLSDEALKKLDTTKAYKGDKSLINATREFQAFFKNECQNKISLASNLIIKEENYTKAKKAFEAKNPNDRKQADVDAYNTSVNEYNNAVNEYNTAFNSLNAQRTALLEKWNKTSQAFLDANVPKYKK
ncbi:MAG TPA: hypothetical protein VNB90_15610 [Cytophagaceae bacterium]|nr:hypothetical protein [Cytophagaceae bacterium]